MQAKTTRERREARAERLREWADKREQKATAASNASHDATAGIPFGQPILVGHHSERRHRNAVERGQRQATLAAENSQKADEMLSKADNIERAADNAIYSDDPDARERLTEKITKLEAQRTEIKERNAAYRKEHRDELKGMSAYQRDQAVPFPGYVLTNLGGNINRLKKRLASLPEPGEKAPGRWMDARFSSDCAACGQTIEKGERILYVKLERAAYCDPCGEQRS